MDGNQGYSIEVARDRLGGVSRNTIYRAVNRKELELVKIGNRSLITARSIQRLLNGAAVEEAV
jgi:excisionase family DNA binding protein